MVRSSAVAVHVTQVAILARERTLQAVERLQWLALYGGASCEAVLDGGLHDGHLFLLLRCQRFGDLLAAGLHRLLEHRGCLLRATGV